MILLLSYFSLPTVVTTLFLTGIIPGKQQCLFMSSSITTTASINNVRYSTEVGTISTENRRRITTIIITTSKKLML